MLTEFIIELSANVEYKLPKLGKYIWSIWNERDHITGFADTKYECLFETSRFL